MALLTTWETRKRITPKSTDTIEFESELLETINKELFQPIRSAMTQDSNHKDLHIPEEAIQNIRRKFQEIGWNTDERQHYISDFLLYPPAGSNLNFLKEQTESDDFEMDFTDNYGDEAGVNAGLPPGK
jgi:hypothetical protein